MKALVKKYQKLLVEDESIPGLDRSMALVAHYHDACEDYDRAGQYFRETLRATHSDTHEFMTTLQPRTGET